MSSSNFENPYLEAEAFDDIDIEKLIHETSTGEDSLPVVPEHGFCVKTKDESATKIFLNFCYCPEMPTPDTLSEDELKSILESDDPSTYRIPMSLGEPHKETDKGGQSCLAYDVIVSSNFFKRIETSELFKVFLVTVGIQGLEDKYNITLNKDDWVILKNKKYHGLMPKHFIRKAPKVTEIQSPTTQKKRESDSGNSVDTPDWVLLKPRFGNSLEARFLLDKLSPEEVKSCVHLEMNEDRLVLRGVPGYATVDVYLPNRIETKHCKAVYRKGTKILSLKMPLLEEKLVML